MQARETVWGEVKIGSFIKDLTGKTWKVIARKPGYWGLQDKGGDKKIIKAPAEEKPVAMLYLTRKELQAMLVEQLGAEFVAEQYDGENIFRCQPFDSMPIQQMKGHLLIMHGVSSKSVNDPGKSAGMSTKKQLIFCHDEHHKKPGPRWTAHIHSDQITESW